MIFDSDEEEAALNQVDQIAYTTHAVPINNNAAENLMDFNNETVTVPPLIDQQANVEPTSIHPPLTESNMEALGSGLPTDQEQLTSTPIPAFDTPTSKLTEMYNASKLRVNDVIKFTKPNTESMKECCDTRRICDICGPEK